MNGYERRKQKKIEQIYGAAFQLFVQHGFQRVSVNEIAQMAKVSPATIYNYFGTKEQLYADMLIYWMDNQLEQYGMILDSELSFPEKTKKIMLLETQNLNLLSEEFPKVPSSDLDVLLQMMEAYNEQKVLDFFMRYVSLGKREGYIHKDYTEETAMLYFSMYKNELGRYWRIPNQEHATRSIDQLIELFFYGLAGQMQKRE